jgi:hypothetical protein
MHLHQGQDLMFDLRRELPNQIFDEYTYDARATGIRIVPPSALATALRLATS